MIFFFVGRVGALHIIFNDVIDDPFISFVSGGKLVLVKDLMGDAFGWGRLRGN